MKITHPKVASLAPEWAPFSGCTILFDDLGVAPSVRNGTCDEDQDWCASDLHDHLADALAKSDSGRWREIGFCPLPPESYHVTLADLVHAGNVRRIAASAVSHYVDEAGRMLPEDLLAQHLKPLVIRSGLLDDEVQNVAFTFAGVANRGDRVVVAELKPDCSSHYQAAWERLYAGRELLARLLSDELSIVLPEYKPHVSLGYFANTDFAAKSGRMIEELNTQLVHRVGSNSFQYGRPSLYMFNDMASYVRFS